MIADGLDRILGRPTVYEALFGHDPLADPAHQTRVKGE